MLISSSSKLLISSKIYLELNPISISSPSYFPLISSEAELFSLLNKNDLELSNSPVSPKNLGQLIKLISTNEISGKIAKDVLEEMFSSKKSAREIVDEKGLKQVTDQGEIEKVINEVIKDNPKMVQEYLGGKDKLLGFFVGQAMKKTKGKANPKLLNDILKQKLNKKN